MRVKEWRVDGVIVPNNTEYTFTLKNISADVNVTVMYKPY